MYQLEINRLAYLQNKFGIDYKEQILRLITKRDELILELKES